MGVPPSSSRDPIVVERRRQPVYHGQMLAIFEELKTYVGFGDKDAGNLVSLARIVGPGLPQVVDRFYEAILRHPNARRAFSEGQAQIARLHVALHEWLVTLFSGKYDSDYVLRRARIGHTHVRVGLPQHFMFGAIEVIWQELSQIIRSANPPAADEKLDSLHKLLTIETGIMLESYRVSYSERVRKIEHDALEERLTRAEQLAEVGQLAASLAHEIKNPLAGISGAIQILRDDMEPNDRRRAVLEEVLRQVTRLDGTVKDLLTYARPQHPEFRECRVDLIVERVSTLLRAEASGRGVRFQVESGADLAPIEADEHQVEQLLLNLLLNALHACGSEDSVRLHTAGDDTDLTLLIEDQGEGMDAATARRAFEPFFTTKTRGTGLGLSICRRIVDAHGGTIRMHSEIGRGTAVEVRLPRRQSRRDPDAPK